MKIWLFCFFKKSKKTLPFLLLLGTMILHPVLAESHWLSSYSCQKKNGVDIQPRSLLSLNSSQQISDSTLFDIVVSLYNDPQGDNIRSTIDARTPYEQMIEYFADGVYESTNGVHRLNKVRIYRNSKFESTADVVWKEKGRPHANISGWGNGARHIYMFNIFDNINFLNKTPDWGGYALAHEWGHYTYSLYDEYKEKSEAGKRAHDGNIRGLPWEDDTAVDYSIMSYPFPDNGNAWLNFSDKFSYDKQDINYERTAQGRKYGASCWETLARPVIQDYYKNGLRLVLPIRAYWPDLAAVAPKDLTYPRIDLPGSARDRLEIIWMDEKIELQIVIDKSGSMGFEAGKMENAKKAAKLLVENAPIGIATIGVIAFDSNVNVIQPLTLIDSQNTKDTIIAQINTITAVGGTAIGDAAQKALDDLLGLGTTNTNKIVFLLTDGDNQNGRDPLSVIPAYQNADIPIFTFAYGSDAVTSVLQEMAGETNGNYYFSPTTLAAIQQAFLDANREIMDTKSIASGSSSIDVGQTVAIPLEVDSTINNVDVITSYMGEQSDLTITLIDPNDNEYTPTSYDSSGNSTSCKFGIESPQVGTWYLSAISNVNNSLNISYDAQGTSEGATYALAIDSITGTTINYPEPIVITASLQKELPIANAVITNATIEAPDGNVSPLTLRDDGIAPDVTANDGVYSAIIDYTINGTYQISLTMDNSAGNARLTYNGLQPTPGENGHIPDPLPDVPISENFVRQARLQVTVQGVVGDDHGNNPTSATQITPDNTDVPGKIDYDGDVDFFKTNIPNDISGLVFRVSELALGMEPKLTIYASDENTELASGTTASSGSWNGYVYLTVPTTGNSTLYAKVSHTSQTGRGTYNISVGPQLRSDTAKSPGDNNASPVSNFGWSPSEPKAEESIQFTDSSSDSDGTIASRKWFFGDGETSTSHNPTHSYNNAGTYSVALVVTDNDGATANVQKQISISKKDDKKKETTKKFCFIATAAYGSYLDPHVKTLSDFRDKYLLTNTCGKTVVEFYYKISPPLADYISKHETLKTITRFILTPVVYSVEYPKTFLLIILLLMMGIILISKKIRINRV